MKNSSILKTTVLIIGGLFLSLLVMQCTKVGVNASALDRGFNVAPDTSHFSPFYDKITIAVADITPGANDIITAKGVQSTIKEYCGISTCHGGPINPKLSTYAEIRSLVNPGSPETSKLWELLTTNDLNKAMPPVNATHEFSITDKTTIYNWIKNGAKEYPDIVDFRPAAVKVITNGCTSANCHNEATSAGSWARAGLLTLAPGSPSPDTTMFVHVRGTSVANYCLITNKDLLNNVWNSYKDSIRQYYSDTIGKASFKPYKTFSAPVVKSSVRGPLSTYDDILFDIWYPKGLRSNGNNPYTPNVRGDNLNAVSISSSNGAITTLNYFIARFDSTLMRANPRTQIYSTPGASDGDMAYADGGLQPSDVALIKAWYFADPNIPDVWKYGFNNVGIFKYKKAPNTIIIKH